MCGSEQTERQRGKANWNATFAPARPLRKMPYARASNHTIT